MLTKDQALTAREFWHMTERNTDGTPLRARRNGKTKTWVKRPHAWNIPVKYGLKQCFNITEGQAVKWCTPENWQVEHVLFAGLDPTETTVSSTTVHHPDNLLWLHVVLNLLGEMP